MSQPRLYRMGEALYPRPSFLEIAVRSAVSTLPRFDPTRYGVADYSFYEGPVNWTTAKQNGLQIPVIRVGQGYYGIDSQFKASAANSKGLFPIRDFYWMLDTHQSANGQATSCANALMQFGKLDPDSILWADFELNPADAAFLWGFLATIKAILPGVKLGIYTGYSYWQTHGSVSPSFNFAQYPLWISWPIDPYREPPMPLKPWTSYYYHQWTFGGDGRYYGTTSLGLDLDYLNPALVNVTPPPTPQPTGTTPPMPTNPLGTFTVNQPAGGNVRRTAEITGTNVVGAITYGSRVYGSLTPDGKWVQLAGYMSTSVLSSGTPDPTPAPVSTGTTPPPSQLGLYRVLTDGEFPLKYGLGGMSRTAQPGWTGGNMTPATIKLHGGDDPVTGFSADAAALVMDLDTPHGTFGYVTRTSAGWSNAGQTWPAKMEPIIFEGNVVYVYKIVGNQAFIRLWDPTMQDPKVNADVIHRWTNIDKNNMLHGTTNPAGDGIGYIVLDYAQDGVYWIELDKLAKL